MKSKRPKYKYRCQLCGTVTYWDVMIDDLKCEECENRLKSLYRKAAKKTQKALKIRARSIAKLMKLPIFPTLPLYDTTT